MTSTVAIGSADAATWLTAGSGCVVEPSAVPIARQFLAYTEFRASSTGTIVVNCPVTPGQGAIEGSNWKLDLYFLDASASGDARFIQADIIKMRLSTGASTSSRAVA